MKYRKRPVVVEAIQVNSAYWTVRSPSGHIQMYTHDAFIAEFEPVEATVDSVPAKLPPDWDHMPEAIFTEGE